MSSTHFLEKARAALRDARTLLAAGSADGACDRCYYAAFDSVMAALYARPDGVLEPVKSHRGAHQQFAQVFVKGGLVGADTSQRIKRLEAMRLAADYSAETQSLETATQAVLIAEQIVDEITALLAAPEAGSEKEPT